MEAPAEYVNLFLDTYSDDDDNGLSQPTDLFLEEEEEFYDDY